MRRIILGICAAGVLSACSAGNSYSPGGTTIGTKNVTVGNDFFSPANVRPDGSGNVIWTWDPGGVVHHIVFEDSTIAASDSMSSGTITRHFTADGLYRFRCTIHSTDFTNGMHGTVVVGAVSPPDTGSGGYGYP